MLPGEAYERGLYLAPQVHAWVTERHSDPKWVAYKAQVRAHLSQFVKGAPVNNKEYMKRLRQRHDDPPEIWEIRIIHLPQYRIFGAFYAKDHFVCTNVRERRKLNFASAKLIADNRWNELFPGRARFSGTHFSHYVTNGVHFDW